MSHQRNFFLKKSLFFKEDLLLCYITMIFQKILLSTWMKNINHMYRRINTVSHVRVFITYHSKELTIKDTFIVSASGFFLSIQLIYELKTNRCLPKCTFLDRFAITYSEGHRSNTEKTFPFWKKVIFPCFEHVKMKHNCPMKINFWLLWTHPGLKSTTRYMACTIKIFVSQW